MTKAMFIEKADAYGTGDLLHRVIQAAVKATVPGRQAKRNIEPTMVLARKAALRALRRAR